MRIQTRITASIVVGGAALSLVQAGSSTTGRGVEDLGATEGKPVTNGFVFVDGKYLSPPYVVTRQGAAIVINGLLVEQPCPWPLPKKPEVPKEEPKLPASVNETTSPYDPVLTQYLAAKQRYAHSLLNGKALNDAMVKAYAELPCVKEAKPGISSEYVDVTWKSGGKDSLRVVPLTRLPLAYTITPARLLEQLERTRANYEDRPQKGDYYFLGVAMSRTTGTSEGALEVLPGLVEILKSSKDAAEVHKKLKAAGHLNWGESASQLFFSNRAALGDLEQRLEALRQRQREQNGSVPHNHTF